MPDAKNSVLVLVVVVFEVVLCLSQMLSSLHAFAVETTRAWQNNIDNSDKYRRDRFKGAAENMIYSKNFPKQ